MLRSLQLSYHRWLVVECSTSHEPSYCIVPPLGVYFISIQAARLPFATSPVPQYPVGAYAPFFGDPAGNDRIDEEGNDISLLSIFIKDIADIQQAIFGLSIVRNKRDVHLGLKPEEFALRQQILTAARAVLIAERKFRLSQMYNYWTEARVQSK